MSSPHPSEPGYQHTARVLLDVIDAHTALSRKLIALLATHGAPCADLTPVIAELDQLLAAVQHTRSLLDRHPSPQY